MNRLNPLARRFMANTVVLLAVALLSACASPTPNRSTPPSFWSGRLVITTQGDPPERKSAQFELRGTETEGSLTLLSPLGTTLATASWTPGRALLRTGSEVQTFSSAAQMGQTLTGTDVPLNAIFGWVHKQAVPIEGWTTDFSQLGQGRVNATRRTEPPMEIKLIVDTANP